MVAVTWPVSVVTDGISPGIHETLRQLGLTEYGARCYVALLALKSGEASAVAEAAQVPRTKVYAALKDLVDAGWVLAENGRPVVYRPASPEERIAQAEKQIAAQVDDAVRELQARYAMAAQMVPMSVYMLRGRDAVGVKVLELLGRAREEVFLNLGFLMDGEAPALCDGLARLERRGVLLHLLVAPRVAPADLGALARNARKAAFPIRAMLVDGRHALVTFETPDGPVGLWNPTQAFVEMLTPMLRAAWEASEPLASR